MNRRDFLAAAGSLAAIAAIAPEQAFAREAANWTIGWTDLEGDLSPRRMRRVAGRAPADLAGVLYRNGPAKFRRAGASATHWFDGDGMVRRYAIDDGEVTLSARFVDTPKRRRDTAADAVITPGFGTPAGPGAAIDGSDAANAANTSVLPVGNDIWALWEGGSPTRIDGRTLETRGLVTLGENMQGMPFLAHPRREATGRVWNLGLSANRAIVWSLAADGRLEAATPIALPRASYLHDFTATERYLVLVLQPWMFTHGRPPFVNTLAWRPAEGTQVLVLDKADLTRRRTFELPAFSFFHLSDACEDGGDIRFSVCATPEPSFAMTEAREVLLGRSLSRAGAARRASVVLRANGSAEFERSSTVAEFPTSDPRRAGMQRQLTAYLSGGHPQTPWATAVVVHNARTGAEDRFDFGAGHLAEEMVFMPRPRREAEGDAWLLGTTVNLRERATELHLFNAGRASAGPVATWRADTALPIGFHGAWVGA